MALTTSTGLVNQDVMVAAERAINIGASVLKLGDRKFESTFGAEDMTGETIRISLMDGGEVWEGLDISESNSGIVAGLSLDNATPKRDYMELSLDAMTAGMSMTQSDIDLLAKDTAVADRCVARFVDKINRKGEAALSKTAASVAVIEKDGTTGKYDPDEAQEKFSMGLGMIEASKVVGAVQGIASPLALRKLNNILAQGGMYQHSAEIDKAIKGELKNIAGIDFTDCGQIGFVTGADFGSSPTGTLVAGSNTPCGTTQYTSVTVSNTLSEAVGTKVYFTLANVNNVDDLGNDLGEARLLVGTIATTTSITLETPLRGDALDPYRNCVISGTATSAASLTGVLSSSKTYYNPIFAFKQGDFKVAVKGLAPMAGKDSLTIPGGFGDKGILPIRGTCESDFRTSKKYMRWDAMFGFSGFKNISGCAFFIER